MLFGRPRGITLILAQKIVWGSTLVLLAAALLILRLGHETHPFQELFENELATDPRDALANFVIHLVPTVSLRAETMLGIVAALYALLEGIEAWGLWVNVTWVEVVVLVETAAFIPYEVWELVHHAGPFKIASLVINVLIVWYLAGRYRRRHTPAP